MRADEKIWNVVYAISQARQIRPSNEPCKISPSVFSKMSQDEVAARVAANKEAIKAKQPLATAQETQKTLQTQPNPSQANGMAGDLTSSKPQMPQSGRPVTTSPEMAKSKNNTFGSSKQQRAFKVNLSKDVEVPTKVYYTDIPR